VDIDTEEERMEVPEDLDQPAALDGLMVLLRTLQDEMVRI
jgi:hypothetical protein